MNLRLFIMAHFLPDFIVKKKLLDLIKLTAQAFNMDPPGLSHCSLNKMVEQYARFTRTAADMTLQQTPEQRQLIKEKLYQNARQFGDNMRKLLHPTNMDEVMTGGALLYKMLRIEFEGDNNGEIVIRRCFFSSYYTSPTCKLISAIDAGVMAGLSDGGIMTFSRRITEGQRCCRAHLRFEVKE
jgi:hypothetical protein